ncbi:ATP/GTP-binding protein [Emticicia sp.]|uniref:AAA family ATPase n=1 Tax=Emticicia sp. TaxID=1930953 RepID=UPI003752745C
MLIEFSVSNFRSIKDLQTLSFLATAMNEHEKTNVFDATDKIRLLKSTCIYGANGSGKSNLVKAMWAMISFIKATFEDRRRFDEHIQPFKLNTSTRKEGSFFQIVFILEGRTYRYGFVYLKGKIMSEWLFGTANKNEVEYFTRENKNIYINKERFKEGIGLESKTREDNLFLNVVYEFNGKIAETICIYFTKILIVQGFDMATKKILRDASYQVIQDKKDKYRLLEILKIADAEIFDINLEYNYEKEVNQIISQRKLFNENEQEEGLVNFDFDDEASDGTKKMFYYSGTFVNLMKSGGTIIIDQFDERFHTSLTKAIVKLFNSEKNKSAQLCFVTHDTNLLDNDLLRRDQIYFAEKNQRGETAIYSLNEIKGVRNDSSLEKDYIKGKYGAIPFIKNLNNIFE